MKEILALALVASLSSSVMPAESGLDAPHRALISSLESQGVTVLIGHRGAPGTCSMAFGSYRSMGRRMEICLEGGKFDADSLDTIRHESIHFIQDCRAFRPGDGTLKAGLSIDDSYERAAAVGLDLDQALMPYVRRGMGPMVIHMEAEAISGAKALSADQIADQVKEVCGS